MPCSAGATVVTNRRSAVTTPVALANDKARDPFHAYGGFDMLEVFAQSVKIAHLDRPRGDWSAVVARTPADVMGLGDAGWLRAGGPADPVLFRARSRGKPLSRPQHDRTVLGTVRPIDAAPPGRSP